MIYERLRMEFNLINTSPFIRLNVVVGNYIELNCQSHATPAPLSDE